MSKKITNDNGQNKPSSKQSTHRKTAGSSTTSTSSGQAEEILKKHFKVEKLTTNPTEAQIRMMALHLWLMDVARDPDGKHIFLTLEAVAEEYSYDPLHYHGEAIKLFLLLREEGDSK